jgi:splicing factor 3B subunit 2
VDQEAILAGIATDVTGLSSSLPSGIESSEVTLNLRKSSDSVAGTDSAMAPQLFTVLEQRKAAVGQSTLMGTEHVYVIPGQEQKKKK